MEVIRSVDHEAVSELAADCIAKVLAEKPNANILVATGNTPMRAYEILAGRTQAREATAFQLDEYVGVPEDDSRSLFGWMRRSFVVPLGSPETHVRKLDGCASELEVECAAYEASIASTGGIDLAILGLGPNGHLGFNEPPSQADSLTRTVVLTPESLASNAAYWKDSVPTRALTVGMKAILASRRILLVATGERKHEILTKALHGPIGPDVPASLLRLTENVTVLADAAALGTA